MIAAPHLTRTPNALRMVAGLLVGGTICYVVPSALHGNPPVESAADTLAYVHERPSWRLVHLVNIAAVLMWAAGFSVLPGALAIRDGVHRAWAHGMRGMWWSAAAVFAVYFSVHAFGLSTAADQYFAAGADRSAVLERTRSILIILGSMAFTAQALVGLAVAGAGAYLARATPLARWIGWLAVVAGLGWAAGAVAVNFAIIVPFTVLAWLAILLLAWQVVQASQQDRSA